MTPTSQFEMWCRTYPVYTNAVRVREHNAGTVPDAGGVALRAETVESVVFKGPIVCKGRLWQLTSLAYVAVLRVLLPLKRSRQPESQCRARDIRSCGRDLV